MSEIFEKILSYALGGVAGLALGMVALSFDGLMPTQFDQASFLVIAALVGMIVSANFIQHRKELLFNVSKKVRDETVALITHEMRTGLTSTSWAIELILENYKDQLKADHTKMLQDVVKSINATVMHSVNLLDVSLLEIGKLVIALKWVKLGAVEQNFREIIEKYNARAERTGIELTSDIKLDPERQVEVDMLRLRITLENLLENAMQYVSGPAKKINVSIRNDEHQLHIAVKDNGIGIPVDERDKIFKEFYRASNARKMLSTGSGIGLHMCKQYTKAHHGTIRFESKENEGTTFFITLPLKTTANVNEFLRKI